MMKIIVVISALVAIAAAKPSGNAPIIALPAPVVTATSSQYYHRINNGLAAYIAPAPYVATGPYVAAASSYVAAAPYVAAASPYVAAATPYIAVPRVVAV